MTRPVALITGSASGVGAATARLLAQKGWNVTINYAKSADRAEAVAADCRAAGADVLVCQADVGREADCRHLVAETVARWNRLDALVNSAGTTKPANPYDLEAISGEDMARIYQVNCIGPYTMVQAAAPHMKRGGRGAIVHVSSLAGIKGTGSSIAYAASKAALNTITLAHARVLGPEIRVNAVCPAMIQGRWLEEMLGPEKYAATKTSWEAATPLKVAPTPEQIANAVVWLVDGADLITGQLLVIDSGFSLGAPPPHAR